MSDEKELIIVRGSTPLLSVTLPEDISTSDIATGIISISQRNKGVLISKTLDEMTLDGNKYSVFLKQSETLKLDSTKPAAIQAKFCTIDDIVLVSFIQNIEILPVNNEKLFEQDNPSGDTYEATGESGIEIVPDLVDFSPDMDVEQITISTDDYTLLRNKPVLNGVTINGNQTSDEFGIYNSEQVDALLEPIADKDTEQDARISTLESVSDEHDTAIETIEGQIGNHTLARNVLADEYTNAQIDAKVDPVSADVATLKIQLGNHTVARDVSATEYTNDQIDTKVGAVSDEVDTLKTKVNTQLGNHTVSRDVLANEYTNAQIDTAISTAVGTLHDDVEALSDKVDTQLGEYTVARNVLSDEYTNTQIDTKVSTVQTAVDTLSGKVNTQLGEFTVGRNVAADEYTNAQIDAKIAGAGDISALEERIDTQLGDYVVSRNVSADEYSNTEIDTKVNTVNTRIDNQIGSYTVGRNVLSGEYTNTEIDGKVQAVQDDVDALDSSAVKSVNTITPVNGNVTLGKCDIGLGNVTNDAQVKRTEMGTANGVATLDANGLVPSSQLPSYVDDVLEYPSASDFPSVGETGKIYIAIDTNMSYRWSGTGYAKISGDLALGETSSTAYAGNKGKANRDDLDAHIADNVKHITASERNAWNAKADASTTVTNVSYSNGAIKKTVDGVTTNVVAVSTLKSDLELSKEDVGLGNVDNTSDLSKPVSTATQSALDGKVDKVTGKGLSTNDYTTAEKNKLSGIESGAQVNTITGVKGNSEATYRTGNVNITKANIGLGNVDNTADADKPISTATQTALSGKVDKVTGKGLSTNDFTDTLKTKLNGIATGAEVNVQANWNTTDSTSDAYILNKPTIPSKTSDLTNDSGFITSAGVPVKGVKGDAETTYRTGNVNITKDNIGLANVDNTSDADKPISTATQAALNAKITNPSGGVTGQVLKKTELGVEWANESGGGGGEGTVKSVNTIEPDSYGDVQTDVELTKAEYDALPSSKETDGVNYWIKDGTNLPQTSVISAEGVMYTDSQTVKGALDEQTSAISDLNNGLTFQPTLRSGFSLASWGYVTGYKVGSLCIVACSGLKSSSALTGDTPAIDIPYTVKAPAVTRFPVGTTGTSFGIANTIIGNKYLTLNETPANQNIFFTLVFAVNG